MICRENERLGETLDTGRVSEILGKIPVIPIFMAFLGYIGFNYYQFNNSPTSPLLIKRAELANAKQEASKLKAKLKEVEEFKKNLDLKREEIRNLAVKLDEMKATLSERLDIAGFLKTSVTEARRAGLNVISLKPGSSTEKEFYAEQSFEMVFRGVFVQLIVFMDRLAILNTIVKPDAIEIKPIGPNTANYVEIEGKMQLKAYRYLGTRVDEVAKVGGSDKMQGGAWDPAQASGKGKRVPAGGKGRAPVRPGAANKGGHGA